MLFVHARLIDETGSAHSVRDLGALEAAVARPRAKFDAVELYPDVHAKSAALLGSIVIDRQFVDGNKRTGIAAAALTLLRNGWRLTSDGAALETITLGVAASRIAAAGIVRCLREHSDPVA